MPYEIFEHIKGIHHCIPTGDKDKAWEHYYAIDHSLEFDPNVSDYEKDCLRRVNQTLAEALRQKTPMSVGPTLSGLQSSLERRTTGPDGWPLRR